MPSLAMVLAVLFWASSTIGNKAALGGLAITEVASARFLLAAAMLWLLVALGRQRVAFGPGNRLPLLMGVLDPGLVTLLILAGLSHTVAVNVAVFWSLMPLLMPILGRLVLGEPISLAIMGGAAIAFSGTLTLVWHQSGLGQGSLVGDALALAGILCACVNQLIARRVAQSVGRPMVTTAAQMTVAMAVAALALVAVERPPAPFADITGAEVGLLLFLAVATASPFFLYNFALQRLPVGRASLFSCLSAPFTLPMAALFLGERITPLDVLAVAIVVGGVALPQLLKLALRHA
ncbi:MAG: DMT family transporter [Alphaproteobacteria bacterium]|jgi:drug/metabolite transporter (DMT)-like permease|nr:DMT family transporter [Alphaproteobacteria bacterium]